jgi:cytochrome P450
MHAEPGVADRAIEELLRWDSPVQLTMRIPTEPIELAGARLEPHQAVVVVLGSANHDPSAFPNADVLDVAREPTEHVAFGYGIHFCLGAQLARLEGEVALRELARRFPGMRLADGEPRWRRLTFLRGVERLPLRV